MPKSKLSHWPIEFFVTVSDGEVDRVVVAAAEMTSAARTFDAFKLALDVGYIVSITDADGREIRSYVIR